jgi:hypothetical protein
MDGKCIALKRIYAHPFTVLWRSRCVNIFDNNIHTCHKGIDQREKGG